MMMVDGEAAAAMGELARLRWLRSVKAAAPAPVEPLEHDPWPRWLPADLENVEVAIARTEPAWREFSEVNEIEKLHLHAISSARRSIYLENQYFTSPLVGQALAARLREPDGPEVVVISTRHSPSYFDTLTMDRTRDALVRRLMAADVHGRLRVYFPRTSAGRAIIVHSKVAVIDDRLVRIGSGNLNNRSWGFDTECDVAIEAPGPEERAAIVRFRSSLIGHFVRAAPGDVEQLTAERGLVAAMDALTPESGERLVRLEPRPLDPLSLLIATYHLGDPLDISDSWRPWSRPRRLRQEVARLGLGAPKSPARVEAEIDDQGEVV
jgi:phosphatidylserine/phosphatidylglycerophosphate/cardiolipin synthase-like enzyme